MERQQALTILASAGASAAATAALLFLWLPAAAPPDPHTDPEGVAALRREVGLLTEELAARSSAPPAPMVAERVVEIEGGRARDELARRCDDLLARCDGLEETVANLSQRLAEDSSRSARPLTFLSADGTILRQGSMQIYEPLGNGVFGARDAHRFWATQANPFDVDLAARPINSPSDQ